MNLRFIILFIIALFLGGCAQSPFDHMTGVTITENIDGSKITEYGPGEYNKGESINDITACRDWVRNKELKVIKQYDKLTQTDRTFALMHRETMKMISSVWGDGDIDPCKPGTNQWDAYIVYAKEQSKTYRQVSKDGFGFAGHATTVAGIAHIVGSVSDKMGGDTVGGNKTEIGRDNTTTGGDAVITGNTNSQDEIHYTQTKYGDGSDENGTTIVEKPDDIAPIESE